MSLQAVVRGRVLINVFKVRALLTSNLICLYKSAFNGQGTAQKL
jgi:hypothetical protein